MRGRRNPRPSGGGAVGTIAAGTTLNTHRRLEDLHEHQRRRRPRHGHASTNSVSGSNGATIPAGATVNMTVTQLKRSENCE